MKTTRLNPDKIVRCYATLCESEHHSTIHPFVVYLEDSDGGKSQEQQCRNLRDCLLVGNGMVAALMACNMRIERHNVEFDPRFTWLSSK
jgi:hypothetical protein